MKAYPLAVFLGKITDLALSFTVGPFVLYELGINESSPYLYQGSLALGLVAVVIGGYVTAVKSPSSKIFNTIIFAVIQLVIGALAARVTAMPLWFNVASFGLMIPASLLGAYLTGMALDV